MQDSDNQPQPEQVPLGPQQAPPPPNYQQPQQPPAGYPQPQQQYYPQYAAAPPQPGVPGAGLSLAGFIVALVSILLNVFTFGLLSALGLGLSIFGRSKTKKAGRPSGLALAGIIISSITLAITSIFFLVGLVAGFANRM